MRDQIATVEGHRCRFSYIILSRVSRLGITLLMHRTGRFSKPANHHQHAIFERSWVDNMERCRPCLRASCRRRALIKCSLVFSFGLCWCDAREVCGPSAANVHGKEYIFACHRVVQGFTTYPEGYHESNFFYVVPDVGSPCSAMVIVRWTPRVVRVFWSKPELGAWESTVARWNVVLDDCGECSLPFHVARECFGGLMIQCSWAPLSEWISSIEINFTRMSQHLDPEIAQHI
jgi:hypothetical protein